MTELGAESYPVLAIKVAERLNYNVDEVFALPLAKLFFLKSALDVLDGKRLPTVRITNTDKEIVNLISENQDKAIQAMKDRSVMFE